MSTAYHPQSNGMTEQMKCTLETVIRAQVNATQDDWDEYLAMVEYAINDTVSDSTGYIPFQLMYRKHPKKPIDILDRRLITPMVEEYIPLPVKGYHYF